MFMRPREVAKALGLSERTIQRLARTGQLPAVRIGRSLRIPAAALERLVEQALGTK